MKFLFEKQTSTYYLSLCSALHGNPSAKSQMNIYIHKNDEQFGPFNDDQLSDGIKTGQFTLDDLAWIEGQAEWVPLRNLWQQPQVISPAPKNIPEGKHIEVNKSGIMLKAVIASAVLLGALLTTILMGVFPFAAHKTEPQIELKEIKGEVFITTKGADTKRLSGILIRFYQREELEKNFADSVKNAAAAMPPYEKTINRLQKEILETEKEFNESEKSGGAHFQAAMATINLINAQKNYLQVWVNCMNAWPHASYYFDLLPQAQFETRSDSDGKFTISLPKGDWIIVAEASRHIGKSTDDEWYYWTYPVKQSDGNLLSNHNIVTSGNSDSVLKTEMGRKPFPE